jgi:hypothetical protein
MKQLEISWESLYFTFDELLMEVFPDKSIKELKNIKKLIENEKNKDYVLQ